MSKSYDGGDASSDTPSIETPKKKKRGLNPVMALYIGLNKEINGKIKSSGEKINIGKTGKVSKQIYDKIKSQNADLWSEPEKNKTKILDMAKKMLNDDWNNYKY